MTIHITTLCIVLGALLILGFIVGWKSAGSYCKTGNKKNNENR